MLPTRCGAITTLSLMAIISGWTGLKCVESLKHDKMLIYLLVILQSQWTRLYNKCTCKQLIDNSVSVGQSVLV